ncbi:hypothetical protein JTB14_027160 [Gonioctena quinquepunctata]|nr:hypothetical protein JTB14_027160 [Gonioctena quinquepunctata]
MDFDKKLLIAPPKNEPNLFSRMFFCWVLPYLKNGYGDNLNHRGFHTRAKDLSTPITDELEKKWNEVLIKANNKNQSPSLKEAILKTFGISYSIFGIWLLVQSMVIRTLLPLVLEKYINHFQEEMADPNAVWYWAISIILLTTLNNITYHHCFAGCSRIGMRVRVACSSLVYRKVLKLSQSSFNQIPSTQINRLLSEDVKSVDAASPYLHFFYVMPIQLLCSTYILWHLFGVSAFAGVSLMVLESIPLRAWLATLKGKLSTQTESVTDHRVEMMTEVVSGIHLIKMYAWEMPFEKVVMAARM